MKPAPHQLHRATALLLAAAALPLTPLLAQDTAPVEEPPATEATTQPEPAPAEPTPAEKAAPQPEATTPVAVPAPRAPAVEAEAPVRATTRAAPRAAPRRAAPAPAPVFSAPPVDTAPVAPLPEAPVSTLPAPDPSLSTEVLPEPAPVPVDAVQTEQTSQGGRSPLLLLLAAALLVGGLAFFLLQRRRRRSDAEIYEQHDEEHEGLTEALQPEPAMAAPAAAPAAAAPIAAVAAAEGRPELDLALHPLRAGVTGDEARVDFELVVANRGSAAARDLRVSTFMFSAGQSQESEMERALIERRETADAELPRTDLEAGMGKRIESSVELATATVEGDSVLPVVVAEARYRLPDGSEERTSVSYAVGVPDGEELAHFAIENPSGLHEGVEARALGEAERV